MKISVAVLVFSGLIACNCSASQIFRQCPNGEEIEHLESKVVISDCKKVPCKLKKSSTAQISIKLKPKQDVEKLTTSVLANINGNSLPFVGVDGADACKDIYDIEGKNVVGCPLKANEEYVYLKVIDVLPIYPSIQTVVHWALKGNDGDVFCFEVPVKIVN